MNKDKKIIVIGSGFGGIAAALRMRAKGYQVTLLEKHPDLGGRARVFKKNGNLEAYSTINNLYFSWFYNFSEDNYSKNPLNY